MTFSGKPSPTSARRRSVHSDEHGAARVVEPRDLVVVELVVQTDRREAGAVQDLVRVGVADAAQEPRIGERALERVALAEEDARETSAGPRRAPRGRPARARRAPPRRARGGARRASSSRPRSGAACPVEKSNAASPSRPGGFVPRRAPAQAAGDHEVQDEIQIVLEGDARCACRDARRRRRGCRSRRRAADRPCAGETGS